jgi:hypothetical protein
MVAVSDPAPARRPSPTERGPGRGGREANPIDDVGVDNPAGFLLSRDGEVEIAMAGGRAGASGGPMFRVRQPALVVGRVPGVGSRKSLWQLSLREDWPLWNGARVEGSSRSNCADERCAL